MIETVIHHTGKDIKDQYTVASVFDPETKVISFGVAIPNKEAKDNFCKKLGRQKALGIAKSNDPVEIDKIHYDFQNPKKEAFAVTKEFTLLLEDGKVKQAIKNKLHNIHAKRIHS